ncbi:MAG: HD domain-containing protein [Desulfobacteraceae bacterium]|nr:HD domain-containing protein [Desulfobacteraceae bacterium]
MKIKSTIDFLKEIEKFKTCERVCQTTNIGRAESDAEHSWHLAIFLILLENEFENIDFAKLLKIALIHDLPEIYAGDTNPYRGDTTNKEEKEKKAAQKLFSILPDSTTKSLSSLFDEYINQESLESQIVKSADKLMPLIQNICTNAHHSSYRKLNVEYQEVLEYMGKYFSGGVLEKFYRTLLSEAHDDGVFSEPEAKA